MVSALSTMMTSYYLVNCFQLFENNFSGCLQSIHPSYPQPCSRLLPSERTSEFPHSIHESTNYNEFSTAITVMLTDMLIGMFSVF